MGNFTFVGVQSRWLLVLKFLVQSNQDWAPAWFCSATSLSVCPHKACKEAVHSDCFFMDHIGCALLVAFQREELTREEIFSLSNPVHTPISVLSNQQAYLDKLLLRGPGTGGSPIGSPRKYSLRSSESSLGLLTQVAREGCRLGAPGGFAEPHSF